MKEKKLEAETVREEILRSVRELKEIRLNYVPHTICEERRESCRYPKRRRQNRTD